MENVSFGFEYDITAHCDLNCAACSHYSPIAERDFVTAEKARRELSRMGEITGEKCSYIRMMGGEPLLNPDVEQILKIARDCFPVSELLLVTNGIQLLSQPESFWRTLRDNAITLSITKYPIKLSLPQINAYATVFGVKVRWYRNGELFSRYTLDVNGINDAAQMFSHCHMRNCAQYHNGKLYHCGIIGNIYKLNKAFNRSFEVRTEDYIDIFGDITPEDVLEFFSHPAQFCRYCNPMEWQNNKFPWHVSERKPEEWIKEETTDK